MLESRFVKKLQEKPEPVKHAIMWTATIFIMVLIFAFWIWNFSRTIDQNAEASRQELSPQASGQPLPSAWAAFKSQSKNFFDLIENLKLK